MTLFHSKQHGLVWETCFIWTIEHFMTFTEQIDTNCNSDGLGVFINQADADGIKCVKCTEDKLVCLDLETSFFSLATDFYEGNMYVTSDPCVFDISHYDDATMSAMASEITNLTIVYSIVYSVEDQRKHQSSESLAFVWGIHRRPVNYPHKGQVTRKMFPFDDVIMAVYQNSLIVWYQATIILAPIFFRIL